MERFSYTAERNDGEVYHGIAEAPDRFELYQIIRREGGHLLNFDSLESGKFWTMSYWNAKVTRVSEQTKITFLRNLGAMLTAGLSLSRALSVIERQTKNPRMNSTISQVSTEVRRGDNLYTALAKFPGVFPKLTVAMVRAGEEAGNLASSLALVADQMERMHSLKKKIRSAMIYPCIILIAIFIIATLMMIFVVPTLAATFENVKSKLPISTQIIIWISNFLSGHTILALGSIVSVVVVFYVVIHSSRGKRGVDYALLHLPLISPMVREVNAARTARTLASLVSSGVDVLTALDITREVLQNSYFQEVLTIARDKVGQGETLSTTFIRRGDLFPPLVGEMMAVGEETGQTSEMLKNLAVFYEDEVDRKTKDMSTIIEPFLMLFIGAAVGFFAVAMITPIYQVSQNIN